MGLADSLGFFIVLNSALPQSRFFHEVLISRLDKMGQSGTSLDAYATVLTDLINREIAEVSREPTRQH